jgi:hypothetical protein
LMSATTSNCSTSVGPNDGATDSGQGNDVQMADSAADASTSSCGTMTCSAGTVCVHAVISGGACVPPSDAGVCYDGAVLMGNCCIQHSESYWCATLPSSCAGNVNCGCAQSVCLAVPDGGVQCPCQTATATGIECACLAP